MTEAAPAYERVYQALCFYNSTGPPRRQAGFMIFNVLFHDYCYLVKIRSLRYLVKLKI
jgi:hypothetical protein